MGAVTLLVRSLTGLIPACIAGLGVYVMALTLLGTFETDDMELVRKGLPLGKLRRKLLSIKPWR